MSQAPLILPAKMEMQEFYTEIFINATPAKVWKAFVEPNTFFQAFFGANLLSTFEIGSTLKYAGMEKGQEVVHIYGKVLAYEKEALLAYTDHPGPRYHEKHASLESQVKITFSPIGQSTRLTVTNDHFSENNPMQAEAKQWYLILSNLKTYIETGKLLLL